MIKKIFAPILGVLSLLFYMVNLLIFPVFVLLSAGTVCILPTKRWRMAGWRVLAYAPFIWTAINSSIMRISNYRNWDCQLPADMQNNKPYLVICNHRSWIDILVLYRAFNWTIQPIKFFMKKELLWSLPMAGLACKAIGYPFMERHSAQDIKKNPALKGKDIETTRASCRRFMQIPSSLMNFVEGTRYTPKKAAKQNSPYQHLLKPKAGGVSIVLQEMQHHLAGVIDATIFYDTDNLSFWNFCRGGFKRITVRTRILPIEPHIVGDYHNDRTFRVTLQQWLNDTWKQKDELITELEQACQNKP